MSPKDQLRQQLKSARLVTNSGGNQLRIEKFPKPVKLDQLPKRMGSRFEGFIPIIERCDIICEEVSKKFPQLSSSIDRSVERYLDGFITNMKSWIMWGGTFGLDCTTIKQDDIDVVRSQIDITKLSTNKDDYDDHIEFVMTMCLCLVGFRLSNNAYCQVIKTISQYHSEDYINSKIYSCLLQLFEWNLLHYTCHEMLVEFKLKGLIQ